MQPITQIDLPQRNIIRIRRCNAKATNIQGTDAFSSETLESITSKPSLPTQSQVSDESIEIPTNSVMDTSYNFVPSPPESNLLSDTFSAGSSIIFRPKERTLMVDQQRFDSKISNVDKQPFSQIVIGKEEQREN